MKRLTLVLPLLLLLGCLCSCTEDETQLGLNLVEENPHFAGSTYTLTANRALSVRDDSLLTANYSYGIIGNYHDATFGHVSATLFTQIALPDNTGSVDFNQMVIDSVVMTLVKDHVFPDTNKTYHFHFEVMQLAEAVRSDSVYVCSDNIAVNPAAVFFDDEVAVTPADDTIRLKMASSIIPVLAQSATADEFAEAAKGLRIRLTDAGDEGMLSLNMNATMTCLTVYYHLSGDEVSYEYPFLMGTGAAHFLHFSHTYDGTLSGADSLDGSQRLYLEPMGGYNIYVVFDDAIRAFAEAHPNAVIHNAELLLPISASASAVKPSGIIAMSKYKAGVGSPIVDYYSGGVDGMLQSDANQYRLRVTRHVQNLLRDKKDEGMTLLLDSRISAAARTFINGPSATDPIRIEIIYSE